MASLGFKTFRVGDVDENGDFQSLKLRSLGSLRNAKSSLAFKNCSQVKKITASLRSSLKSRVQEKAGVRADSSFPAL